MKILAFLFLILAFNSVYAQNEEFEFRKSFIKTVRYPEELKNSCTPAFTNLLIDISQDGKIESLLISDSAPKALIDEFEKAKGKLNIQFLETLITNRKLKNCGIIIPIFYIYETDYCANSFSGFISGKYLTFKDKPYNKLTISLPPIFVNFYKPLR